MKYLFSIVFFIFLIFELNPYNLNSPDIKFYNNSKINILEILKKPEYSHLRNLEWEVEDTLKLKIIPPILLSPALKLYLNCEAEIPNLIQDLSGNMTFLEKDVYLYSYPKQIDSLSGKKACFFRSRTNKILLKNQNAKNLEEVKELTIFFKFYPLSHFENQILFQRVSYFEEEPKVFSIKLNKQKIYVELRNLIHINQNPIQIYLESKKSIINNSWNSLLFSISLKKGYAYLFLNNELSAIYQFHNKYHLESIKFVSDEKSFVPPFQIGGKYMGYMDEVYIFTEFIDNPTGFPLFPLKEVSHRSGRFFLEGKDYIFPIIDLGDDFRSLKLKIDYLQPTGTQISFFYRTAVSKSELSNMSWIEISPREKEWEVLFERKKNLERFFQLKVRGWIDSSGKFVPEIQKMIIEKKDYEKPQVPRNLRIVRELSNEKQVCLEWEKIPDEIIEEYGGYKIHIGINSKFFDISLYEIFRENQWKIINRKNLEFPLSEDEKILLQNRPSFMNSFIRNHIRVCLSNDDLFRIYEKNLEMNYLHKERIHLIFEKERVYFFAVSSYLLDENKITSSLSQIVIYRF